MKLNLGSGKKKKEGYLGVDIRKLENVDIVADLTKIPYPFQVDSVDEIFMEEFLEHISWREVFKVLKECWRILKPNGILSISSPDIGKMCEYYVNREVCDCVPRKVDDEEDYKPNPKCFKCCGRAKINPVRWHMAFTGNQNHEYDFHREVLTFDYLSNMLNSTGFKNIKKIEHIYKLKVSCIKKE